MDAVLSGTHEPGTSHYELLRTFADDATLRRADDELNYRRFFAVTTLAGVRVEDPEVFADTHREIGRWFGELDPSAKAS